MLASPRSATGSPRNRLKFLCSYGGRILPRPSDGNLKYVGGETRVVVVPRNTTFSGLMRKLTSTTFFEADVVLKYQLFSEDLDSLVSVTCDEDLQNMIDEYDRQQSFVSATSPGGSAARLRLFLFPANQSLLIEPTTPAADSLEQRYIDAVNGIRTVTVAPSPRYNPHHLHHPNYTHHHRSPSSNESSPKSGVVEQPSLAVAVAPSNDASAVEFTPLQRVYSSPNLLGNNVTAVQQRFCGHKGGRLLGPVRRAAPGSSQVGGHQRNGVGGSGRLYSPVHKRGGGGHLEESHHHHRREGSGGMWEMDWRP